LWDCFIFANLNPADCGIKVCPTIELYINNYVGHGFSRANWVVVAAGFPPETPTRGGQARLPRAGIASGMYATY